MEQTRYYCDRCKAETPQPVLERHVFRTCLVGWTRDDRIHLCDRCGESFELWLKETDDVQTQTD